MEFPSSGNTSEYDPKQPPNLFARLAPRNAKAYKAFTKVVDAVARDPEKYKHHAQFLSYDPHPAPLQTLLQRQTPEMSSDASSNHPEVEEITTTYR